MINRRITIAYASDEDTADEEGQQMARDFFEQIERRGQKNRSMPADDAEPSSSSDTAHRIQRFIKVSASLGGRVVSGLFLVSTWQRSHAASFSSSASRAAPRSNFPGASFILSD